MFCSLLQPFFCSCFSHDGGGPGPSHMSVVNFKHVVTCSFLSTLSAVALLNFDNIKLLFLCTYQKHLPYEHNVIMEATRLN